MDRPQRDKELGKERPKQPASITNFLGRIGRRIRSRSPVAKRNQAVHAKEANGTNGRMSNGAALDAEHNAPEDMSGDEKENTQYFTPPSTPSVPSAPTSVSSRFGAAWGRLSGRKKKAKVNQSNDNILPSSIDDESMDSTPRRESNLKSPRFYASEGNLAHVTMQRGIEIPEEMSGVQHTFVSEDNLASTDFEPVYKTPSYIRISRALNGYTKPTSPAQDSPVRALGKSLVERRLEQFREPKNDYWSTPTRSLHSNNSQSRTPLANSSFDHSAAFPQPRAMGNDISTPAPIKSLITKFDSLHLCSAEKSNSAAAENEKIQPHRILINQPEPCCLETPVSFGNEASTNDSNATLTQQNGNGVQKSGQESRDEENEESKENGHSSSEVEKKPVEINGGVNGFEKDASENSPDLIISNGVNHKEEFSIPNSGEDFARLSEKTRSDLQKRIDEASRDLETDSTVTEDAATNLRVAIGKGQLLLKKKFAKFDELVHKNLNPIEGDLQPAKLDDLHGYWALIAIELTDVDECFEKVTRWKAAGWNLKESENVVQQNGHSGMNGTKPVQNGTRPAVHRPKVSTKPKLTHEQKEQQTEKQASFCSLKKY
ncbi:hypothetical protein WR25_04935 isoform E [Diploscapter pachys]|uniref:Uncharacterized protein n=1 Tax=Diploscapter pachys TaxID=2018661 RepID=A0A2A2JR33_9BILA|nr:hypothetical protein WR25_04935 isoform E [Diploscapter pachys]